MRCACLTSQPSPIASSASSRRSGRIGRSIVRLMVKKRCAVGRLDQLADRLARRLEGRVQMPARAGAAEMREGEALAGIALGDVPGRIDPQHEEGHALGVRAAERRQPVRDLLDIGAELRGQPVDRVAMLLGRAEELAVGHHDRAGGIIGEAHVQQAAAAGVGRPRRLEHPRDDRREFEQRQLVGDAEGAVLGPQQRRQHQHAAAADRNAGWRPRAPRARRRGPRRPTRPSAAGAAARRPTADGRARRPASPTLPRARDNGCAAPGYNRAPRSRA